MTAPERPRGEGAVTVERTPDGAKVLVDGAVRATFVGDLDQPEQQAAFDELLHELFGADRR